MARSLLKKTAVLTVTYMKDGKPATKRTGFKCFSNDDAKIKDCITSLGAVSKFTDYSAEVNEVFTLS